MTDRESIDILFNHTNLGYGIVIEGNTKKIREALSIAIDALKSRYEYPFYAEAYQTGYEEAMNDCHKLKGKWIYHSDYAEDCRYGCNICGNLTSIDSRYCSCCGVKMERSDE